MAPHAASPPLPASVTMEEPATRSRQNGHSGSKEPPSRRERQYKHTRLQHTRDDELHDLICIGFGPASLAIAIALYDALEESSEDICSLRGRPPKVAFLERQSHFSWHAGMLLEGSKMQISFIKDMATLRNPRSEFTFLNYLHRNKRLVEFTNLSTFLPQRIEYEDYMRWCASHFEDVVDYNQHVLDVVPEKSGGRNKRIDRFVVTSRDMHTQAITTRRTRHVVIAVGGKPDIPKSLPQNHPRVIHSSHYAHVVPNILNNAQHPYTIAVLGSGQSAAEIFDNLHSKYPNARTQLLIRGAALRPSDDSPFVNEIFDPSRVDDIYNQDPTTRAASIASDRNTNYGVVRLELLERLYETLYTQRIRYRSEDEWPHRILPHRTVTGIEDAPSGSQRVILHIRNDGGAYARHGKPREETLEADAAIVATGYTRDMHQEILKGSRHLMPGGDAESKRWEVGRDYRVRFEDGRVSSQAGVWLQGCNESTHGLSDTLLSILAVRAGEMVKSIFGGSDEDRHALEVNTASGNAADDGRDHVTKGVTQTNGVDCH